jgi:hypothetical protein
LKFFDKVFGVDEKRYVASMKEKPIDFGQVEYMGGHKMFPTKKLTTVYFYEDRFVLEEPKIVVPYGKIKDISNSTERKRHEDWASIGLFGLLWKKNAIYTLIEYDDGVDTQKIVIDFKKNVIMLKH